MNFTMEIIESFRVNGNLVIIEHAKRVIVTGDILSVTYELLEDWSEAHKELLRLEAAYESLDYSYKIHEK